MKSKEKDEQIARMRHSTSHVMAESVQCLFPEAKFGIGPMIENGFYYDFELPRSLAPDDLPVIEIKMREIIRQDVPFVTEKIGKEKARKVFATQPYKLELIDEIAEPRDTIYRRGFFPDLGCG